MQALTYIFTLDSHCWYGPFWDACGIDREHWAHEFAANRGFGSYTLRDSAPAYAQLLPLTYRWN